MRRVVNKPILTAILLIGAASILTYIMMKKQDSVPQIVDNPSNPSTSSTTPVTTPATTTPAASKPQLKPTPSPVYKKTMTSLFWVGEASDAENAYIPNHESYWDSFWMDHFGGIDDPENRCGYNPCGFTPKENPFYFALPYGDRNEDGSLKASMKKIPWYKDVPEDISLLKNHWIEIVYNGKTCYAQWQDVGPNEMDDFDYVFGSAKPQNTFGVRAGLDLSPATWTCLGITNNALTEWRFVDEKDVPDGPWKKIVTTRQVSF